MHVLTAINRTIVELKSMVRLIDHQKVISINRTIVELK